MAVPDNIQQSHNVWPARQILQDLDLSLYLLLLHRLEHLDDTLLVVGDIDALKNLRVLSASWGGGLACIRKTVWRYMAARTDLPYDLVVLEHTPCDVDAVVIPVCPRHVLVHICIYTRHFAAVISRTARSG